MKKKLFIAFVLLLLIGCGISFAKLTDRQTYQLSYGTDAVRIVLSDDVDTSGYVVPEQIREINMKIENLSAASNVRWKAEISVNGEKQRALSEELLNISADWNLKEDGWHYSKDKLKTGETLPLFEKLRMPSDMINAAEEGDEVEILITAQAIQAEHDPDWETTEIQTAKTEIGVQGG